MKRLICMTAAVVMATLSTSGCASTGFLGFLATTQYVDKHVAGVRTDTEAQLAETNNEVHKVQLEVRNLTGQNERRRTAKEFPLVEKQFSKRLDQIPEETLRAFVRIIEDYLDQRQLQTTLAN